MDLTKIEQQLRDLRLELNNRLTGIHADVGSGRSRDSEEQASENENEEVLVALAADARGEIAEIDRALIKLQTGTYGVCVSCGDHIDPRRLEAYPMAEKCMECA
jgi:DnaK suppressor protein